MNKVAIKTSILSLVTILLMACGGGGGEGSPQPQNNNNSTDPLVTQETETMVAEETSITEENQPADPPVVNTAIGSTNELVATDSFLFKSSYDVRVSVQVSPSYGAMTICQLRENLQPDYGHCLLRASLDAGVYEGQLLVTNDTQNLALTLWDFNDAENPAVNYWNLQTDGELIRL